MHKPPLPTVSVIIPALNEAGSIVGCIESVADSHTHEVIVVDGGSTDGTRSVAVDAEATIIEAPEGRARQMNAGAAAASGDILLFLHADCTLERGAIGRLRRILRGSPRTAGYFRQQIDGDGFLYRLIEFGSNLRARWLKRPYGDQAMFFERQTFYAIGGFPLVPILEDLMISRRALPYAPWLAMPETVTSSARRWRRDGGIQRLLCNWSVALGELRGVSLSELHRQYAGHAKTQSPDCPSTQSSTSVPMFLPIAQEVATSGTD